MLCVTWIIHQQLWGYKVEEELHLGVREQKKMGEGNTTALESGNNPQLRVDDAQLLLVPQY
jgi:hypothetical protein